MRATVGSPEVTIVAGVAIEGKDNAHSVRKKNDFGNTAIQKQLP
jgi:hypothetical protein